jgi:hypothetical protein
MLTCPECGEQIAVKAQKNKISSAYDSAKTTVKGRTKASSFLTATVFLTIMLVLHIIAVFGTMGIGLPLWIVPIVFMGISMATAYKLYSDNEKPSYGRLIKRFARYEKCTQIIYKILAIVFIAVGPIVACYTLLAPWLNDGAEIAGSAAEDFIDYVFSAGRFDPALDPTLETSIVPADYSGMSARIPMAIAIVAIAAVAATAFLLFKAVYASR